MNEERTVEPQYAHCDPHRNKIFLPNSDTGGLHERPTSGETIVLKKKQKTYMRSTSKREAEKRAK